MHLSARITGIKYKPLLCSSLNTYEMANLGTALSCNGAFLLKVNPNDVLAVSWWVSPKRTRSYPYARVYDTLGAPCTRKVTIIPVMKDEGKEGDRDYIQWDTVSLMSLLDVYVLLAYYNQATPSKRYAHKVTDQAFDLNHISDELEELQSFHSSALHWNLKQTDKIGDLGEKAIKCYETISKDKRVKMHGFEQAKKRFAELKMGRDRFMKLSRSLAENAQSRESVTIQLKEKLTGNKATITIANFLGGEYYLTVDELIVKGSDVYLIEGKHSEKDSLPSVGDIKDALLKMVLFTNLQEVTSGDMILNPFAAVKLSVAGGFAISKLSKAQERTFSLLTKEADENGFKVLTR